MLTKSDVWEAARKFGGVSVQYGNMDVFEIIMQGDSKNKCCIVLSDSGTVDATIKRIAKSISDKCFIVKSAAALEKVISKVAAE